MANAFAVIGLDDFTDFSDKVTDQPWYSLRSVSELLSLNDDLSAGFPKNLAEISLFTDAGNQVLLKNQDDSQFKKIVALGISLYIDYELFDIFKPSDLEAKNSYIFKLLNGAQTYPLFAIYEEFDQLEGFWKTQTVDISELTSRNFVSKIKGGARVSVFTRKFLSELINSKSGSDANNQGQVLQASGLTLIQTVTNNLMKDF